MLLFIVNPSEKRIVINQLRYLCTLTNLPNVDSFMSINNSHLYAIHIPL